MRAPSNNDDDVKGKAGVNEENNLDGGGGSKEVDSNHDPFRIDKALLKNKYDEITFGPNWEYRKKGYTPSMYGWKLHIRLLREEENVARAWKQVIFPTLMHYEVKFFKIAKFKYLNDPSAEGQICTVYLFDEHDFQSSRFNSRNRGCASIFTFCNGHAKFVQMLHSIENGLISKRIEPSQKAELDSVISGSRFITYRNDHGVIQRQDEDGIMEEHMPLEVESVKEQHRKGLLQDLTNPSGDPDIYDLANIRLNSSLILNSINEDDVGFRISSS